MAVNVLRTILLFPLAWSGREDALFTPRCVYKWAASDNAQLLEWPVTADCLNCKPKEEDTFGMQRRKFGY